MIETGLTWLLATEIALDTAIEIEEPTKPTKINQSKISGNSDGKLRWTMVAKMGLAHVAALYGILTISMNWRTMILHYIWLRLITFGYSIF
jgi:hypothetical protein